METSRLMQNVVALSVVIIVFAAVLVPILGTVSDYTVDGDANTGKNAASAYLKEYKGTDAITITYTASPASVTVVPTGLTTIVTSNAKYDITATSVTVTNSEGITAWSTDTTITIPSNGSMVLVNAISDDATYGIWTSFTTPVNVTKTTKLIVTDTVAPYFAYEYIDGNSIAITSEEVEDEYNVYAVTAVGTNGSLIAPLEYTWYEQVPALTGETKTVVMVIPIIIAVGLLMSAVYMFVQNRN